MRSSGPITTKRAATGLRGGARCSGDYLNLSALNGSTTGPLGIAMAPGRAVKGDVRVKAPKLARE